MSDTWNDGGTTYTAIKMDVTDTASDAASLLMDLLVGGTSQFFVNKDAGVMILGKMWLGPTATDISGVPLLLEHIGSEGIRIQRANLTSQYLALHEGGTTAHSVEGVGNKEMRFINRSNSASHGIEMKTNNTTLCAKFENDGNITSPSNTGTAGTGVTALEYGGSHNHVTTLTLASVLPAITGDTAEAEGFLAYTFPAGVIVVNSVHMDVSITQSQGNIDADTPEVGIGSLIATGAVSDLTGTAGFDDYVAQSNAANCTGTKTDLTEITASGNRLIAAGGVHTLHFNAADLWDASAGGDTAPALAGDIWIDWRFLGA